MQEGGQKKKSPTQGGTFLFWWAIKGSNLGPTGYTPCELRLLKKAALRALHRSRCARGAICARLACASTDSLALDYVASVSNRLGQDQNLKDTKTKEG